MLRFPRHRFLKYSLILAAIAISIATIHAEFSRWGVTSAAFAAAGLFFAGLSWVTVAFLQAAERGRCERLALQQDEELRKARRTLMQQQATAKMLVERDLELSHANDQLREIDQIKSEFVTIATHQLRTPLSAIRWTLYMLIKGDVGSVTDEQRKFLEQAYKSNNRLIALLHDILVADRIESGKVEHTGEHADAAVVIDALLTEVRMLAEKQGVSLRFIPSETPCPPLAMEPGNLRTVLQNLIENAIQYSKINGVVTVALACEDARATISVTDTGIGIPRDMQHHIFSRFYRAENAVRTVTDGSGLGLYIAKRIVEHENGTLTFTSTENVGTTFVVTLPVA